VISGQIMELHHAKHHATYVANLNKALEQYAEAEAKQDLQKMISLQGAINFNGGGVCPNKLVQQHVTVQVH
jgi:Fe-Mn family superoxide dismutase